MTTKQIAAAAAAVVIIALVAIVQTQRRSSPPHVSLPSAAVTHAPEPPPADCLLPGPPPVPPSGEVATAADMKLGHDVMQAFVDQLQGYQTCRDAQADRAAPFVPAAQKQQWLEQGDAAIDEAHDLAAAFGRQLAAFKARNPGQ